MFFPIKLQKLVLCALFLVAACLDTSHASESLYDKGRFRFLLDSIDHSSPLLTETNFQSIRHIAGQFGEEFSNCRPRVCFGLDGSAGVSPEQYELQVQITQVIAAILGGLSNVQYFAVQYGGILQFISRREETRIDFITSLGNSQPLASPITFVAPALQFCSTQFRLSLESGLAVFPETSKSERTQIVLLARSESTFNDFGPFGAIALGEKIRAESNTKISALLIGAQSPGKSFFKDVVGGGKVISAKDIQDTISAISEMLKGICE